MSTQKNQKISTLFIRVTKIHIKNLEKAKKKQPSEAL